MNYRRTFPKTKTVKKSLLGRNGDVPVSCYVEDGVLIPALSTVQKEKAIHDNIIYAGYSANIKSFIVSNGNFVTQSGDGFSSGASKRFPANAPSIIDCKINSEDGALFIGDAQYSFFYLTGSYARNFTGGVTSCVLKNGRIFGVDNTNDLKIKWSGEGGFNDWKEGISGAGWVCLENGYGKILNLIVYKEKIAVIREYGVTLFTGYGTPENYRLNYLGARTPKVYKNTAIVAEENLLFYTEAGLYRFDGSEIKRAEVPLRAELKDPVCCTAIDGTYLLSGYSKSLERRAVLAVDLENKSSYLIDDEVDAICHGEKIFAYDKTQAKVIGQGENFKYICAETDFSLNGKKTLKEINILGGSDLRIEVSNGVNSRILWGLRGKFRPNMRGNIFKITVTGKGKIYGIEAVAEAYYDV